VSDGPAGERSCSHDFYHLKDAVEGFKKIVKYGWHHRDDRSWFGREGTSVNYHIDFKPRALKDVKKLPKADQRRVMATIEELQDDLSGDVKKLTNFTPEYRLRVGKYRVLFEVEDGEVVIYRIVHRKDAYK
jgi:mRNA interferase RelE/StbE